MPVLNQERFLEQAIASVTSQTWRNLVLTVVDDGSSDASRATALRAARDDQRIRVICHHDTRGIPQSLNEAISQVEADYFSFLGGDDRWLPGLLEGQLALLSARPEAVAVACDGWVIDKTGARDGRRISDLFHSIPAEAWGTAEALLARPHVSSIGILCRYEPLRENGFTTELPHLFDWLAWIQLAGRAPIVRNPRKLCEFRVHDRNSSLGHRRLDAELPTFADLTAESGLVADRVSQHWIAYHRLRGWQHLKQRGRAWGGLARMVAIRPMDRKNLTQLSQMVLGEEFNQRLGLLLGRDAVSRFQ